MDLKIFDAVVALAAGISAILLFMQIQLHKSMAAPHLKAYVDQVRGELWSVRVVMFPAEHSLNLTKISAKNCFISKGEFKYLGGASRVVASGKFSKSALPLSISLPPFRASSGSHTEYFLINPRKAQSSIEIAFHARIMFFPVRYKIAAATRIAM
jgi:hypothetical protein